MNEYLLQQILEQLQKISAQLTAFMSKDFVARFCLCFFFMV